MNYKHKPDPWDDDPAPTFHGLTKAELAEATGYTINETAFLRDGMPATPGTEDRRLSVRPSRRRALVGKSKFGHGRREETKSSR